MEEAREGGARIGHGERRQDHRDEDGREHDGDAQARRPSGPLERVENTRREIRRLGDGEVAAEGDESPLELAHGSTSNRRRSRARAVRDFTVPRRTPSTSAVSSSLSSRK